MSENNTDLYKCINMYYELKQLNKTIEDSFYNTSNLTKKQKKSKQFIDELLDKKDKFIMPEALDYSYNFDKNELLYKEALEEGNRSSLFGCSKITLGPDYYKLLYDNFIESFNMINNQTYLQIHIARDLSRRNEYFIKSDYYELKNDKLYMYDISILSTIFASMKVDFNIYLNFDKDINYLSYQCHIKELSKINKLHSITVGIGDEIFSYKEQNKENINYITLEDAIYRGNIEFAEYCLSKINIDKTNNEYCYKAILRNDISTYDWLKYNSFNTDITPRVVNDYYESRMYYSDIISEYGLEGIKRLKEYGYKFNNTICNSAFICNDIATLKWLILNGYKYQPDFIRSIIDRGDFELLDFAKEQGYKINIHSAIDILKKITDTHQMDDECVKIFKWLIENGCNWTKYENNSNSNSKSTSNYIYLCDNVIETNNIDLIKWSFDNGCSWNNLSIINVIKLDNYEILKWAVENGCEWTSSIRYERDDIHREFKNFSINLIIKLNNISILKWAFENGCRLNKYSTQFAIKTNNSEILKWVIENGCKWNANYIDIISIIKTNNIDMFTWAIQNGCNWNRCRDSNKGESNTMDSVPGYDNNVANDSSEYICYDLYKNDVSICYNIIKHGNLDMLKFIIEHDTSSNINLEKLAVIAVKERKRNIIDWLEDKVDFSLIYKYDLCKECAKNGSCIDCSRRDDAFRRQY